MPAGPGKYDHLCTACREAVQADAVVVIVLNGNRGSGFSVQALGEDFTRTLPALLRTVAAEIEDSLAEP